MSWKNVRRFLAGNLIFIIYTRDTWQVRFSSAEYSTVFVELHSDLQNNQILAGKDIPDWYDMLNNHLIR